MSSSTTENDTSNLFNRAQYDETYWQNYLAARPKYHLGPFYDDHLFAYHDRHSGRYDTAHDVGTGPGQVAEVLARRFASVVASDTNATHLEICQARNNHAAAGAGVRLVHCAGEELASRVPAASADAVFSGEALALMDADVAVRGFAEILRPGGTFAMWYYGRPTFVDGDREGCQGVYDGIVNRAFGKFIKGGGPQKMAGWKKATDVMASWFDSVAFPETTWKDVERRKFNTHGKMTFYDQEACDFPIEISSEIGENEKVVEVVDETLWAETWDVSEVRRFIDANLPSFQNNVGEDPEIEQLFGDLERAMGGKSVKRAIAWPVVLILATKK